VAAITGFTALINLFNLLPVTPPDGGRVVKSVAMSIGTRFGLALMIAGMIFVALAAYKTRLIIFVILIPLGLADFLYERRCERWGLAAERRNYEAEQRSFARRIAAGLDVRVEPPPEPRARTNLSRRAIPAVFAATSAWPRYCWSS
jgi:membrane-associated protease RseP (regulator of RpoE activity)